MAKTAASVAYIAVSALLLVATVSAVSLSVRGGPSVSSGLLSRIMYGDVPQAQEHALGAQHASRKLLAGQFPVDRATRMAGRGPHASIGARGQERFANYFRARALSEDSPPQALSRPTNYLRVNMHESV